MRKILWTIIKLLPFVIIALSVITYIGSSEAVTATGLWQELNNTINSVYIPNITAITSAFRSMFLAMGVTEVDSFPWVARLLSYELFILMIEIGYNTIAYLPEMAKRIIYKGEGKQ